MIGKVPLDQLAKEMNLEVEWKAYELRPEGVDVPEKSPEYYQRAWEGVRTLSHQYGLDMKWNRQAKHSRKALEGAKYAEAQGKGNEYHNAVFGAQFVEEQNIDDLNVLTEIAKHLGLNETDFREALETQRYESEVLQDIDLAASYGITGIPCFIVGTRGVMGVQDYHTLRKLVDGDELLMELE